MDDDTTYSNAQHKLSHLEKWFVEEMMGIAEFVMHDLTHVEGEAKVLLRRLASRL